jgi:methenyltetrahydrofolate cyclohydrolase
MDEINIFIKKLSSKEPTPGGGGASALIGAVSAALCSMAANFTSGKKKYAEYQSDIEDILKKTQILIDNLLYLINRDAEVFTPLSEAYGIPKDNPDRDEILENALKNACTVPFEILLETEKILPVLEDLTVKGSHLVISDVGVAASACRSAVEGAALNVYINTKLMKDRVYADDINNKTAVISEQAVKKCNDVYQIILEKLKG